MQEMGLLSHDTSLPIGHSERNKQAKQQHPRNKHTHTSKQTKRKEKEEHEQGWRRREEGGLSVDKKEGEESHGKRERGEGEKGERWVTEMRLSPVVSFIPSHILLLPAHHLLALDHCYAFLLTT